MSLQEHFRLWTGTGEGCRAVFVTDRAQRGLVDAVLTGGSFQADVIEYREDFSPELERLRALGPEDLVVAALSLDSFIGQGANRFFSPFGKPEGVAAKYAFLRLDMTAASLAQGLATPPELVFGKIEEMAQYGEGAALRVRGAAGTDLRLRIHPFTTCSHRIQEPGGMAFLPPSETSAEVLPGTGDGKIVIDMTVGQLYHYGELLGYFGIVDSPVTLTLEGGMITEITGGDTARELKERLFAQPPDCRRLVELGQGLSQMEPTGLIGVDESILSSCHFGFGDGGSCGTHLDMVLAEPKIEPL